MWVEFEIEYGAIPASGRGWLWETTDVEIWVPFRNGMAPFPVIWDLLLEAAEDLRIEKDYSNIWLRSATPDEGRCEWARGTSPYGVLEDDLVIEVED